MIFKTKKINKLLALAITISVVSVYACNTSTNTGTKPVVDDNTDLLDKGLVSKKVDKRNKNEILKISEKGKLKTPLVDNAEEVTLTDYSYNGRTDENKEGGANENASGFLVINQTLSAIDCSRLKPKVGDPGDPLPLLDEALKSLKEKNSKK
jgi:hypothetical protein